MKGGNVIHCLVGDVRGVSDVICGDSAIIMGLPAPLECLGSQSIKSHHQCNIPASHALPVQPDETVAV